MPGLCGIFMFPLDVFWDELIEFVVLLTDVFLTTLA
eukprot:CAMPEP_0171441760 /NCGR_PEP_ID=MMETSP0881-20121228/26237_1 /TAXON_ID=67004 /ORGANISM="Thalassiosira weissflogii, Strain CCMP1336" /LENGTH=35 /DNA_ID= /DNA_START= /DNA_END= /DNA_ORIENTATION=